MSCCRGSCKRGCSIKQYPTISPKTSMSNVSSSGDLGVDKEKRRVEEARRAAIKKAFNR